MGLKERDYETLARHIITQWEITGKIGNTGVFNWVSLAQRFAEQLDQENAVGYRDGYERASNVMAQMAK